MVRFLFFNFYEEKHFNHRSVHVQTWKSSWIYVHGDIHSYADINISRRTPDITKWIQNSLLGLIKRGDAYRTHIFTRVTDDTTAMESFLVNRFTPGHACRIKAITLWGSKCVFVLFIHQEILIHRLLIVSTQEKKPEVTCSAGCKPLCYLTGRTEFQKSSLTTHFIVYFNLRVLF